MSSDNHNSTVWQGYVAAIASLAQSMLFLMAVLTIALTQIAQQIGVGEAPKSPANGESTGAGANGANASNAAKNASTHLKIVFVGNAIELDKQQRKELASALASIAIKPDEHWRIWVEFARTDTAMQREAYLRLLSIRSVMIGNGVPDALIDMNLVKRDEVPASATEMSVYIDPMPKIGASNR